MFQRSILLLAVFVVSSLPSFGQEAEMARWQFSEGDVTHFLLTKNVEIKDAADESKPVQVNKQVTNLEWSVLEVDADGRAKIQQKVHRVRFDVEAHGGVVKIDTEQGAPADALGASMFPQIKAYVDNDAVFWISPNGEIEVVGGPDKIGEAGQATKLDPQTAETLVYENLIVLSQAPLTKEQHWNFKQSLEVPMIGRVNVETEYEFQGNRKVEDQDFAVFAVTMTTSSPGDQNGPMVFRTKESAEQVLFDTKAGCVHSATAKQVMSLTVKNGLQQAEFAIDQEITFVKTDADDDEPAVGTP